MANGPLSLNLKPRPSTSLQKGLRQFLGGGEFLPKTCGMRPEQAWGPGWVPLTPQMSQDQQEGTPPTQGRRPVPGGGRPWQCLGSGWLPRPSECPSSAAQPPAEPSPGRPGEQSGGRVREGKTPEG